MNDTSTPISAPQAQTTNHNGRWILIGITIAVILCCFCGAAGTALWYLSPKLNALMHFETANPLSVAPVAPSNSSNAAPNDNVQPQQDQPKSFPSNSQLPVCAFVGGRMLTGNVGIELGGYYDAAALEKGMPLQEFWSQVNMTGKNSITINGHTYKIPADWEALNDGGGSQIVACPDSYGVWHYFLASRQQFMLTSYIQGDSNGITGWQNDSGDPGSWLGTPGGEMVTFTEVSAYNIPADMTADFNVLQDLISVAPQVSLSQNLEIHQIFTKK